MSLLTQRLGETLAQVLGGLTADLLPHRERLLADEPDFARALLKTLCARLREAETR